MKEENLIKIDSQIINLDFLKPDDFVVFRERYDYSPITPAYYYLDWVTERAEKLYGAKISCGLQASLGAFHQGTCRAILGYTNELDKLSASTVQKIITDKNFINNLYSQSNKIGLKISKFSRKLLSLKDNFKNEKELISYHKKWISLYGEYGFYNCLIWAALGDSYVNYVYNTILSKKYNLSDSEIHTMITPSRPSYSAREELELLKISEIFDFNQQTLEKQSNKVLNLITKHSIKWEFIFWDYIGPEKLTPQTCYARIIKMVKNNNQASDLIKEKLIYYSNLNQKQKALAKKYSISNSDLRLIKDLLTITIMQDDKKEVCTLAQFALHQSVFTYISKKIKIRSIDCIKFTELELWSALQDNDIRLDLISSLPERLKAILSVTDSNGVKLYYGSEAEKFYHKLSTETAQISETKGRVASMGLVKGTARILLSAQEVEKLQPGEILITTMTTPDYISAMNLAAAIVTDEGGMTCHAAIIARELKKPCIIGTKNATKIFHDGDLIEVDANNGVIKMLEK